jgi:DNA-binding response OmpR family regulator
MKNIKDSKILIVEDESIIAEDIRSFLLDKGYNVSEVTNSGRKALEMHRQTNFDLVIMDIILDDDMNGIETANQLQKFGTVPVIFVTAVQDKAIVEDFSKTPYFEYILKPFNDSDLISAVDDLLTETQKDQEENIIKNKMEMMFDHLSDGILILNESGKIVYCNEVIENLLFVGKNDTISDALFYLTNSATEKEIVLEIKDSKILCRVKSVELNWELDQKFLLIIHDLTQLKLLEKKYSDLLEKYQLVIKKKGVGYFKIENKSDPKIIDVNSALIKKLKFKHFSDIASKNFTELIHTERDFSTLFKKLNKNKIVEEFELTFITQEKKHFAAVIYCSLIKDENSKEAIEGLIFFES